MVRIVSRLVPLAAVLVFAACGDISEYGYKECSTRGGEGCGCRTSGRCDTLADGTQLVCSSGTCQVPSCGAADALNRGCLCGGNARCAEGLACVNGNCVTDTGQTLSPPANPTCYTPCRGGFRDPRTGAFVACADDGLLEGCISGAVCRNGTCVNASASVNPNALTATAAQTVSDPGACDADAQCPDFQVCISGHCYSDCASDADCREGRACYRRACRVPCQAAVDGCAEGETCASEDGVTGFCLPIAAQEQPTTEPVAGTFTATPDTLTFSNTQVGLPLVIVNDSPQFLEFTVRKVEHTELSPTGATVITQYPLHWLTLGETETSGALVQEITVGVDGNGGRAEVWLGAAENLVLPTWTGVLEVTNERLGSRRVRLSYSGSAEGQWAGRVYYLANFGELGLDAWVADKSNRQKLQVVGNAFIRRWAAFRDQRISLQEMQAVLTATVSESWRWPSVQARCPTAGAPNPNVACYLYDNNAGISVYSDFLPDNPVPTGVADFPIVMNLRAPDRQSAPGVWSGKILSSESLQYAGDPAVRLEFESDPSVCTGERGCVTLARSLDAQILVGGRYSTTALDTDCARDPSGTFEQAKIPWLVPGFTAGTTPDPVSGRPFRYECRDSLLPFGAGSRAALNLSLAASNPIPDGATRRRTIELIDGALINQQTMILIFRERFPSFLDAADTQGFTAYGFIELQRSPANLDTDDYVGFAQQDARVPPPAPGLTCSSDIVRTVLTPVGGGTTVTPSNASTLAIGVIDGITPSTTTPPVITSGHPEKVHYFCEDTGLFDGGAQDNGSPSAVKTPCPVGSRVTYFTVQGPQATQAAIAGLSCQQNRSCQSTLTQWVQNGTNAIRLDPVWRCTDPDAVFCDNNRLDLRTGKTFYGEEVTTAVYRPLDAEIIDAFRYKTKFRNRSGGSVGFAPETCIPNSDQRPYCYDPEAIEELRGRVDCAAHLYTTYYPTLSTEARSKLKDFLTRAFSFSEEFVPGLAAPRINDGFERLNAELLIMLGDESYTSAFASRFDLAGQNLATFEGALFEPNGINLSGGAGFEMYSLYQATQYYQAALDRFYSQASVIWSSIGALPPGQGFVTQGTVVTYFDRLIRASSQKTRAASEIAKRYLGFNRPELARLVVQRAYTAAYLESVVLSRMMLKVIAVARPEDQAQIVKSVEKAQLTYRAALLDMRKVYDDITDNVTFFGFQPDYVPFPALDPDDTDAFTKLLGQAREALDRAKEKEQVALADDRSFETDSALFQAELSQITSNYEDQLAEICGTFQVTEGGITSVYPAIPKYAYLNPRASLFGDPCGLMGNGGLFDATAQLEIAQLDFQGIKLAHQNLLAQIDDENQRLADQCARITSLAAFRLEKDDQIIAFQDGIDSLNLIISVTERSLGHIRTIADFAKCSVGTSTDCPTGFVASALYGGVAIAADILLGASEIAITALETQVRQTEKEIVQREITEECTAATIDTQYVVKDLRRRGLEIQLETLKLQYNLKLALSQVQKLRNESISIMASEDEATQLAINVEAARNDPNVRIYRNDAILAADRTFNAAVRAAYKATKVYEYYTSQSYADLTKLFLVRMVSAGDFTLESYLADLEAAFNEFEENFGNPDTRVAIISLRDDIFGIPRLGSDNTALSEQARTAQLRRRIVDTTLLDARGYITVPFATKLDQLSPLTRNHKILYIEAEIVGDDVGDTLGRVYVRQRGTGVVRTVDSDQLYYAFPERTAVVNTFFNGDRSLPDAVYRNERLRDRPFVNTGWELVFNRKDEQVNLDVVLEALSDIRLYVFYTDFTEL